MAKQTIKTIGEAERAKNLAKNERTSNNPYNINDAVKNIDGTPLDKAEFLKQTQMNEYSKQKPYDSNSIDW